MTDTIETTTYVSVKCPCDLRTRLVGDGCSVCNPALAAHYAELNIADLVSRIATLEAAAGIMANGAELSLEYWKHRQQRYKNRHPAWVTMTEKGLQEYRKIKELELAQTP